MTNPIPLETILGEFSDDREAWVLQDRDSGQYVIVPDPRFPGRRPIRLFMKRGDAEAFLMELVDVNKKLAEAEIYPVSVNLKRAIQGIASDTNPNNADAFVVHSPNEIYEWLRDRSA
jgi:hypothetical protein